MKEIKNRKTAGLEKITNEMLKYGDQLLQEEFGKLYNIIIHLKKIPSIERNFNPYIQKMKKKEMTLQIYRGITLLNRRLKILRLILKKLNTVRHLGDEQMGFIIRSIVGVIWVLRQIIEKSLEFNRLPYMYVLWIPSLLNLIIDSVIDKLRNDKL